MTSVVSHNTDGKSVLLTVSGLYVDFPSLAGNVQAVRGVDFTLHRGDSIAILGESGSGKSVTSRAIIGLVDAPPAIVRGSIMFDDNEMLERSDAELASVRGGGIAMVFQDSLDSLNPVYTIGSQISEILRVRLGWAKEAARIEALALMMQVGIPAALERYHDYPHQFSGGMRQRICIAMAIAMRPQLLIADEPTTALDVTVQAGILQLIQRLQADAGMALIFVTHDLNVARTVAKKILVMYAGEIVEQGLIEDVFDRPLHPYTKALLGSHPSAVHDWRDLEPISGSPPNKVSQFQGCAFHPRCDMARDKCRAQAPALRVASEAHLSRCHFLEEMAHG